MPKEAVRLLPLFPYTPTYLRAPPPRQVDNMVNKHAVYMTRDGRISLAGLNSAKVDYLARAIVDSVKTA